MTDLMPLVHDERRSLAGFLDTLTPEQWQVSTWCDQWTVQDLVGHLTAAGNITAPHFFGGFLRCGFNFDRFVEGDLRQYAEGTPTQVRQRFDAIIDSNCKPPGPAYVALGEIMVHGEDIRRPLGARGDHPPEHLTTLAELYKKTGAPLRAKKRLDGLRLVATDVDRQSSKSWRSMSTRRDTKIRVMTSRAIPYRAVWMSGPTMGPFDARLEASRRRGP